jgi:hypothetical protein
MGTLAQIREITGPQIVQRFNLFYSVPVQGVAKPGISTGQALDAMEQIAAKALPEGMSYDWTEIAFQQKATGNTAIGSIRLLPRRCSCANPGILMPDFSCTPSVLTVSLIFETLLCRKNAARRRSLAEA